MLFPILWPIVGFALVILVVVGITIGTLTGLFVSMVIRNERRGVWKNAALGVVGTFAGFMLPFLFVGRHYHAEYYLENGKAVARTSFDGLHPWLFAFLGAMLLPIIREAYRRMRMAVSPKPAPSN